MVGRRGPHRVGFGHLPVERGAPGGPLRPGSRAAAAAAWLHPDALLAQTHCPLPAPLQRPGPHAACALGVHVRGAHRFSRRDRAPRARAKRTPVLTPQARAACTCNVGTRSHSARTYRACTCVVHPARLHTGRAHRQCKHTSPDNAHSKRYTVSRTACERSAHTPGVHASVLTQRAHASYRARLRPHTALQLWKQFLARASGRRPLGQCQHKQTRWTLPKSTVGFQFSPQPGGRPLRAGLQQASQDDLQGRAMARSWRDLRPPTIPPSPPWLIAPQSYSMVPFSLECKEHALEKSPARRTSLERPMRNC